MTKKANKLPFKNDTDIDDITLYEIIQRFSNEDNAREFIEAIRWPDGPVCPHCGSTEAYRLTARKPGAETRKGLLKCKACRKQFTVTVGTIFSDSHIPLSQWVIAIHLLCASKKGISSLQIHRMLGFGSYKTAWFLMHRIRWAMTQEPLATKLSGIVESDETYLGGKAKNMHKWVREAKIQGRGPVGKVPVVTLVERGGRVRSQKVDRVTEENLDFVLAQNVDLTATLMTDEFASYRPVGQKFAAHETVDHKAGEYVRGRGKGKRKAHVNTAESFHSLLKRGLIGSYHHWSVKHLARYLAEFDFRFNLRKSSDGARTVKTIKDMEGKRLMYRQPTGKE